MYLFPAVSFGTVSGTNFTFQNGYQVQLKPGCNNTAVLCVDGNNGSIDITSSQTNLEKVKSLFPSFALILGGNGWTLRTLLRNLEKISQQIGQDFRVDLNDASIQDEISLTEILVDSFEGKIDNQYDELLNLIAKISQHGTEVRSRQGRFNGWENPLEEFEDTLEKFISTLIPFYLDTFQLKSISLNQISKDIETLITNEIEIPESIADKFSKRETIIIKLAQSLNGFTIKSKSISSNLHQLFLIRAPFTLNNSRFYKDIDFQNILDIITSHMKHVESSTGRNTFLLWELWEVVNKKVPGISPAYIRRKLQPKSFQVQARKDIDSVLFDGGPEKVLSYRFAKPKQVRSYY